MKKNYVCDGKPLKILPIDYNWTIKKKYYNIIKTFDKSQLRISKIKRIYDIY